MFRGGGVEQADTNSPKVTAVPNVKATTRPGQDRDIMHVGRVIIDFGSLSRDGFGLETNEPQSCASGGSVRVQTSGPRAQGGTAGGFRFRKQHSEHESESRQRNGQRSTWPLLTNLELVPYPGSLADVRRSRPGVI